VGEGGESFVKEKISLREKINAVLGESGGRKGGTIIGKSRLHEGFGDLKKGSPENGQVKRNWVKLAAS